MTKVQKNLSAGDPAVCCEYTAMTNSPFITINGQLFAVRLPTGGAYHGAPSEWDSMLDILGEKNPAFHSKNILSWCQDTASDAPDCRVYRGQLTARHWNNTYHYRSYPHVGYRPVLEPLDPDTLMPDASKLQDIKDGTILTMGSFYVNGMPVPLPKDPVWCGDIPQYMENKTLTIGDSDADPKNQLRFIKCGVLLWCDRNLMTDMSWDTLDAFGLVFGREAHQPSLNVRPHADLATAIKDIESSRLRNRPRQEQLSVSSERSRF